MKHKSIAVYSSVISVVFAAAVIFFSYNIISEYQRGGERTRTAFRHLTQSAENDISSDIFSKAAASGDYAAVLVYKNNRPAYIFPDENAVSIKNTNLVKVYKRTIVSGSDTYDLTAALYILRPASIFYYARFAFIIIFAGVILTVILIIYLAVMDRKTDSKEFLQDIDAIFNEDSETADENAADENQFSENPYTENQQEEALPKESEPQEETAEPENNGQQNEYTLEYNNKESFHDIFSPVTGFGWEQNLEIRLNSEIVRAASSEQDLTLLIIKIPGLSYTDEFVPELCSYLLKEFQFKDMIFEYRNDGFAVIKIDISIENAEVLADSIQAGITNIISPFGKKCFIGISSRSIRMLSAERLIMEAEEALKHAIADKESPIISFHVDIKKYREFIKNNN